jgi:hypothetical protein
VRHRTQRKRADFCCTAAASNRGKVGLPAKPWTTGVGIARAPVSNLDVVLGRPSGGADRRDEGVSAIEVNRIHAVTVFVDRCAMDECLSDARQRCRRGLARSRGASAFSPVCEEDRSRSAHALIGGPAAQ